MPPAVRDGDREAAAESAGAELSPADETAGGRAAAGRCRGRDGCDGHQGRQLTGDSPHDHPPGVLEDEVRFAATPGGIGTSRPSSEDRSSALARRPGSSSARGITVAGQRRNLTGFAGLCAILGDPRTGVQYRSPGSLRMAAGTGRTRAHRARPGAGPLLLRPGSGLRCHQAAVGGPGQRRPGCGRRARMRWSHGGSEPRARADDPGGRLLARAGDPAAEHLPDGVAGRDGEAGRRSTRSPS